MSGFAFSHQFSQRWLATPASVKQTIVQELHDIVTLLQPTTELASFTFGVTNLDDAVESLMQDERIRLQAERKEAERLAKEHETRLEQEKLEQARLDKEKQEQERLEKQRLEAEQTKAQWEQERLEQDRIEVEALEKAHKLAIKAKKTEPKQAKSAVDLADDNDTQHHTDEVATVSSDDKPVEPTTQIEHHSTEIVYVINDESATTLQAPTDALSTDDTEVLIKKPVTTTTPNLTILKQQIINELQVHIEKYLEESMSFMQNDLNKWLKEEIDRQIEHRLTDFEQ